MGITVEHEGYPRNGLIVSNHLSYLDILAFGSLVPCAFVSKQEVRAWPLIGFLAARAGTVFVDRGRKTGVAESLGSMRRVIGASVPLLLFPEGTSSGGDSVLPFRASLLQAASEAAAVTPAAIDYHFEYGSVENEVCYWRDMTFGPHIWNLLGTPGLTALVRFGAPHPAEADRKRLAAGLRRSVMALRNNGHVETAGGPHPAVARCGERHHV
jgi:1-acyl-sn-glycerol-3-phosphate acyltransferase